MESGVPNSFQIPSFLFPSLLLPAPPFPSLSLRLSTFRLFGVQSSFHFPSSRFLLIIYPFSFRYVLPPFLRTFLFNVLAVFFFWLLLFSFSLFVIITSLPPAFFSLLYFILFSFVFFSDSNLLVSHLPPWFLPSRRHGGKRSTEGTRRLDWSLQMKGADKGDVNKVLTVRESGRTRGNGFNLEIFAFTKVVRKNFTNSALEEWNRLDFSLFFQRGEQLKTSKSI